MWLKVITLLIVTVSMVSCSSEQKNEANSTSINTAATLSTLTQLTEKIITKLGSQLFSKNKARARGYESWGYLDGYANEVSGKSDYSWIVPLIIVVGFGTLLIPLMGTLMTTMMTQGTINLTAGRRRKRSIDFNDLLNGSYKEQLRPLMKTFEDALVKFSKNLQ